MPIYQCTGDSAFFIGILVHWYIYCCIKKIRFTVKLDINTKFYNISSTIGHIEVFRLKDDSFLKVQNNLYYLPEYKNTALAVVFTDENQGGLFNPEVFNAYLYGAYDDHTLKEHSYIVYNWLFQFDLEGKSVEAYHLSSRISGFFIEKDSEVIYAISTDSVTLEPFLVYAMIKYKKDGSIVSF